MIGVTMRYTDEFKINVVKSYLQCKKRDSSITLLAFSKLYYEQYNYKLPQSSLYEWLAKYGSQIEADLLNAQYTLNDEAVVLVTPIDTDNTSVVDTNTSTLVNTTVSTNTSHKKSVNNKSSTLEVCVGNACFKINDALGVKLFAQLNKELKLI